MKRLLLTCALLASTLPCVATTYCVSNSGSDSNRGTATGANCTGAVSPWRTIAHVNAQTFNPGDSVLFQRGGIWREMLSIPSSGSPGHPLLFGAYGAGSLPLIKGSNVVTGWAADRGTVIAGSNAATDDYRNKNYIYFYKTTPNVYQVPVSTTVAGLLDNGSWMEPQTSIANVSANADSWYWDGGMLYVHTQDNSNPSTNGRTYEEAERTNCITSSSAVNYVTIDSMECENAASDGIYLHTGSSHLVISNSTADYNVNQGFKAGDPAGGSTSASNIVFIHDLAHHNGATGFLFMNRVTHSSITYSTSYQNAWFPSSSNLWAAGIRAATDPNTVDAQSSNTITFAYDVAYNNGLDDSGIPRPGGTINNGHGIWFDTLSTGSVIEYSLSYDNAAMGFIVENTNGGRASYNIAYHNGQDGVYLLCSLNGWIEENNSVTNNVAYGNRWSGLEADGLYQDTAKATFVDNVFYNNVFTGNLGGDSGAQLKTGAGANNVDDSDGWGSGNVYAYNSLGMASADLVYWGFSNLYSTYSSWETAAGNCGKTGCSHSVQSDPQLTNPSGAIFTLKPSSPAIGAGANLGPAYQEALLPGSTWPDGVATGAQAYSWNVGAYLSFGLSGQRTASTRSSVNTFRRARR